MDTKKLSDIPTPLGDSADRTYPENSFDKYSVTSDGVVISHWKKKDVIKTNVLNRYGYCTVQLVHSDKRRKRFSVHRLVALAFLPQVEGKSVVNHIDGDITNNNVSNLEWCTTSENNTHAYRKLNKKPNKTNLGNTGFKSRDGIPIDKLDMNDNFICTYGSSRDAANQIGGSQGNIAMVLAGKRKSHKGFKWRRHAS